MLRALSAEANRKITPVNMWEVWRRIRGEPSADRWAANMNLLLQDCPIDVATIGLREFEVARQADLTFGRGRHKAKLNFGDCFAYALAKTHDEPLLFKGDDFVHTDVRSAL